MAFTKEQQKLVSEAWHIMKTNMPELSFHFFTTIYNNDVAALKMFSFINDTTRPPKKNDGVLADHAMKIFRQIYESVMVADKTGKKLDIKKLGFKTLKKSVTNNHFQVVKEALLSTVEIAMGKNKEMSKAWGAAYEHLAAAIKATMKQEAEASSSKYRSV